MIRKFFGHFEEVIGAVALFIMVSITFANVVTRYCVYYPLSFTEEVTINLFVWIVMAGAARAFRKNVHLAMLFMYQLFPKPMRRFCAWLSTVIIVLFFSLLTWLSSQQVFDEVALNATSESLDIPTWIYSFAVPLFSVLIIVRYLQAFREMVLKDQF